MRQEHQDWDHSFKGSVSSSLAKFERKLYEGSWDTWKAAMLVSSLTGVKELQGGVCVCREGLEGRAEEGLDCWLQPQLDKGKTSLCLSLILI